MFLWPFNRSTVQPLVARRGSDNLTSGKQIWAASARERNRNSTGFTLIELLVVISIIIVLMGLLFPAFKGAQEQTKKAQAKNDESQIVTAVGAYYTEYGKYPMADAQQGFDSLYGNSGGSFGNQDVFNVLRAIASTINTGDALNPRKVVFFQGTTAKDSTHPRGGFATQSASAPNGGAIAVGALTDPWGDTYLVAMDGNYDGATQDYLPYTDITYEMVNGAQVVRAGCYAQSYGKDGGQGVAGNRSYTNSDDVVSWR